MPTSVPTHLVPPDFRATPARPAERTGLATASLVFGILALILNLLLLPTLLAIVFGAVALAKGTTAQGRAIAGIVLGAVGILAALIAAAVAIPVFLGLQEHARTAALEAALTGHPTASGSTLTAVECPAIPAFRAGATVVCTARLQGTGPVRVDVTFRDSAGAFTAKFVPVG